MGGRRVRDATNKERQVCARGEMVSRQVLKNRKRIRWNTLSIFIRREQRRCWFIVCRSRKVNVGQAPSFSKENRQGDRRRADPPSVVVGPELPRNR